jgi:hypothetical protein
MNIWEFGFLATLVVGAAALYAPDEVMEAVSYVPSEIKKLVKKSVRKIRRKA